MIKKVLSIDMDYIMGPCINLYNDCAGGEEFKEGNFWENVNRIRGIDKHLDYDNWKYTFLVDLLSEKIKNIPRDNIMFATEHDMILELLCTDKNKNNKFEIYNCDHHHDIYYNDEQKSEVERFDFACLANWCYYLGKNEKIHKYYWVRNENSMPFQEKRELTFPVDVDTYLDPRGLLEINFDYMFVCQSSEYFPDKYYHLYEILKVITQNHYSNEIEVWNKPYCEDGKTRHIPR